MNYGYCVWCGSDIRWSNSYDTPHYVHTSIAATLACPGLATGQDVTPA